MNMGFSWMTAAFVAAAVVGLSAQTSPSHDARTHLAAQQQQGVPATTVDLGTVRVPRSLSMGDTDLQAGTYQVRVTETPAQPVPPGQTPQYERWAEFMRGGSVVGRIVVTVVPASDIKQIAKVAPPRPGGARMEVLRGGDYFRIWLNRGGTHYLMHFPI